MGIYSKIKDKVRHFIANSVGLRKNIDDAFKIKAYSDLFLEPGCRGVSDIHFDRPLIVSLTSYGKRLDKVHLVIESLMQQTLKPNRMILWLAEDEFKDKEVPLLLQGMQSRGLEIRFCPDYKSYKKIIPTIQIAPDADVITFDDDILYPQNVIEKLVEGHRKYPDAIIAMRAHRITTGEDGAIRPYVCWKWLVTGGPSYDLMSTTGFGTYFPNGCFHKDFCDPELFMNLAPSADDLWCKFMSLLNGTKYYAMDSAMLDDYVIMYSEGLFNQNVLNGENDRQIEKIVNRYPEITDILKRE